MKPGLHEWWNVVSLTNTIFDLLAYLKKNIRIRSSLFPSKLLFTQVSKTNTVEMSYLGIIYTWISVAWMWNFNGNLHSEIMKTEVIFTCPVLQRRIFFRRLIKILFSFCLVTSVIKIQSSLLEIILIMPVNVQYVYSNWNMSLNWRGENRLVRSYVVSLPTMLWIMICKPLNKYTISYPPLLFPSFPDSSFPYR